MIKEVKKGATLLRPKYISTLKRRRVIRSQIGDKYEIIILKFKRERTPKRKGKKKKLKEGLKRKVR